MSDIAHNLERWVDAVVLRTFEHATVTGMAEHALIPVINALSDYEHPCQALADFFTLQEKFGDLREVRMAYVGDGNNVAHSLLLTAACLGSRITVASPRDTSRSPRSSAQRAGDRRRAPARPSRSRNDPVAAVAGADAVYTDVWASMGQEHEAAERARDLRALPGERRR